MKNGSVGTLDGDGRIRREALELQLAILEQVRLDTLGDEDTPTVCIECFNLDGTLECGCVGKRGDKWPIEQLVLRLRNDLAAA